MSRGGRRLLTGAAIVGVAHGLPGATDIPAVRRFLPRLEGRGAPGSVALTFDDGPDDEGTPQVLAALARADVQATFFLLATMLRRFPDVGKRLVDDGHEVAVHGWDHRNLLRVPPWQVLDGLRRARDTVEQVTAATPRFFRPPYGVLTSSALLAASRAGLRPVLWGSWGRDWEPDTDSARVAATVGATLRGGVTVLLHDSDCTSSPGSWRRTVAALPRVLEQVGELGLSPRRLDAHLGGAG